MISKESALRILAVIEQERNEENADNGGKSWADYDYRYHEVAIAKSAGYHDRAEWMDELRRINQNV